MVEVYGKEGRQINAQDPAPTDEHTHVCTWVNAQCKERSGGKERKNPPERKNPQPSP